MPSCPRGEIVRLGEVAVYHCWSRCVRRACLCGYDPVSGIHYEYRRAWITDFEEKLAGLFGLEVGFRAELSNHLHLVLRTRPDVVETWSDEEVVRRWLSVSHLTKSRDGTLREILPALMVTELARPERVKQLRERLSDPSAFMAALCENVARRSNCEDECSGSFWEDRYKCRELADESAILVCGIYVDLNQIRAGEALTPESSTHTSAFDRIVARQAKLAVPQTSSTNAPDGWMCKLTIDESDVAGQGLCLCSASSRRASDKGILSISLDNYLALLDVSGRMVRDDKVGSIPDQLAPILERLGIQVDVWPRLVQHYHDWFGHIVGATAKLTQRAAEAGRRWYRGKSHCASAFG